MALLAFQGSTGGLAGNSVRNTLPSAMVGGLSFENQLTRSAALLPLLHNSLKCPVASGVASKASKYPGTILLIALQGASLGVTSFGSVFSKQPLSC